MPSLKDLRNRIASTKATQKITKAMQMVAASKLRRAQVAAEAARPFAERMDKVLRNIAAAVAASCARRSLAAATICMALVILRVAFTELIRVRRSFKLGMAAVILSDAGPCHSIRA